MCQTEGSYAETLHHHRCRARLNRGVRDPSQGNVKEPGPFNGNGTKIGAINQANPPMLDFTNPNGQVDLDATFLQTRQATNGDQWLYFGWLRDP